MEPGSGGGITSHLDSLRRATREWLQWEYKALDPVGQDDTLLSLALDNAGEKPDQPQALSMIREAKRLGVPITNGSIWDMPHFLRLELDTVIDEEGVYLNILEANRILAEKKNGKKQV